MPAQAVSGRSSDGCVSRMLSLQLQKSPTPDFEEKCGNSPDISKGISQLGMCKFESSEVSQAVRRSENVPLILAERPANGGLLRISGQSPGSVIGSFGSEIVESLRPIPGKFPFLGDCARRPSLIWTAAPSLQCNSPDSPPWPPANSESRVRTAAPIERPYLRFKSLSFRHIDRWSVSPRDLAGSPAQYP
jgi:hypothetical protein